MRKRIFSIGISAVMIGSLLLTACGGKSSGGSSSSAGETGEAGTAAVGESTAAEARRLTRTGGWICIQRN